MIRGQLISVTGFVAVDFAVCELAIVGFSVLLIVHQFRWQIQLQTADLLAVAGLQIVDFADGLFECLCQLVIFCSPHLSPPQF